MECATKLVLQPRSIPSVCVLAGQAINLSEALAQKCSANESADPGPDAITAEEDVGPQREMSYGEC